MAIYYHHLPPGMCKVETAITLCIFIDKHHKAWYNGEDIASMLGDLDTKKAMKKYKKNMQVLLREANLPYPPDLPPGQIYVNENGFQRMMTKCAQTKWRRKLFNHIDNEVAVIKALKKFEKFSV